MDSLDRRLTLDYMHQFLGYGTLQGSCWFIGMEEGGGGSVEDISKRLTAWKRLNRPQLADLRDFHDQIGLERFFSGRVKLQRTWASLIRLLLALHGKSTTLADVREYQATEWGQLSSDHCLLELLPLPSPSTRIWNYSAWSKLPELRSREAYVNAISEVRVSALEAAISQHQPACVVFYGLAYRRFWETIANVTFVPSDEHGFLTAASRHTTFVIVKHPASPGITNHYFVNAGHSLASLQSCNRSNWLTDPTSGNAGE